MGPCSERVVLLRGVHAEFGLPDSSSLGRFVFGPVHRVPASRRGVCWSCSERVVLLRVLHAQLKLYKLTALYRVPLMWIPFFIHRAICSSGRCMTSCTRQTERRFLELDCMGTSPGTHELGRVLLTLGCRLRSVRQGRRLIADTPLGTCHGGKASLFPTSTKPTTNY